MIPAFQRAAASVLSRLGEDALLRGEQPPIKAHIARGVEMYDREGNAMYAEYVGTISRSANPRKGDTLVVGVDDQGVPLPTAETFVLEVAVQDNGSNARFILRKTA